VDHREPLGMARPRNAVSPGPVDTPILRDFLETLGIRAEEDMRTMDRPGRPADIAPVVAFLLSDDSTWILGANIPVDGGMSAHIQATMPSCPRHA
jgi:NAD(P)-dependent dehydrogenase (short-subunit alcohol dehydrogenase family)